MNVVRYFRSATIDGSIESIARQKADTQKFCDNNNYRIIGNFVDVGYSGTNMDRPDFQRMVDVLNARSNIDAIVVTDLSRISRNHYQSSKFVKDVESKGIKILCAADEDSTHSMTKEDYEGIIQTFTKIINSYKK